MKLAPDIMNDVFDFIECRYPLRNKLRFKSRNIRTVRYGIEFKSKIKTWKPENCPCKLCKIYIQRISYLQVAN